MAIGIHFDNDEDDYDGPLFGRHWLEDINKIPHFNDNSLKTKEDILKAIYKLKRKDLKWLTDKILEF